MEISKDLEVNFLNITDHYGTHRRLLWHALRATDSEDINEGRVLEIGCGWQSTPYLHSYCQETQRTLLSFEQDPAFHQQFADLYQGRHYVFVCRSYDEMYDTNHERTYGVVLVDHNPAERRRIDIARLAELAKIIVIHDTELPDDRGHDYSSIWPLFKYRFDDYLRMPGTTAVSNFINLPELYSGKL